MRERVRKHDDAHHPIKVRRRPGLTSLQAAHLVLPPEMCPSFHDHTPEPVHSTDYLGWHAWAKKMSKTHRQERCTGCGRYAIWVLKAVAHTSTPREAPAK